MKFKMAVAAIALVTLPGLAPSIARAQDYASTNDTIIWSQPRPDESSNVITDAVSPRALDALLAPVALYPDQLLSQILMASTYPLEVVEAARWMDRPENRGLNGDALARALEAYDWDPSVKALAAFPDVLAMLNNDLDWMNRMGEAFLDGEGAVMDSVQRLRREARAAGKLLSDQRQRIVVQNEIIIIEPATLDTIYVPVYDPRVAYGIWPYVDYPPVWFPPPPRYVYSPWISYSFFNVSPFWGWSTWDWGTRRIRITDIPRWKQHNRGRWYADNDVWRHDPTHRRGVGRGDRFRGPLNNDRNVAVNTPRPDRFNDNNRFDGNRRFDRDGAGRDGRDVNRNARDDTRRDRTPNPTPTRIPGPDNTAVNPPPTPAAPQVGAGWLSQRGGGNRGNDMNGGNRRALRPDVQLPDASPPLPNASRPLPAVAPVPTAPYVPNAPGISRNLDAGREQADTMRLRRGERGDRGGRGDGGARDGARRDFQGGRSNFGAAPPAIQPAQPPVMAQSQPGIPPMQSEQGGRRFGGTQQGAGWMAQRGPRANDGRSGGDGGGRRGGGNRGRD